MPKTKFAHRPLKCYEVLMKEGNFDFTAYSFGIFVGRTHSEATYQVARDRETDNPFCGLTARRYHGPDTQQLIEDYEDRNKYWRDTRAYARLQDQAAKFNALYPVGTPVRVVECWEARQWPDGLTKTRTPAWANEKCLYVSVEGQAGGMYLKYVQPIQEPAHAPQ